MLHSMLVKDYMIGDQLAFTPSTNLLKAVHKLIQHRINGAPVVDENARLIGFLSEKDCLKAALDASYFRCEEGLVRDFMSTDIVAVSSDATLIDAIQIFVSTSFSRLPVVEGARLVGQISRHDILKGLEKMR